jgi:uncharacterized CHY-type Zn-finger protein
MRKQVYVETCDVESCMCSKLFECVICSKDMCEHHIYGWEVGFVEFMNRHIMYICGDCKGAMGKESFRISLIQFLRDELCQKK